MTPSLNIEYIFVKIFSLFSDNPIDLSALPGTALFLIESIATLCMVAAVLLLVMIIYVRIRIIQVEHHGFELKAEKEEGRREEKEHAGKNPRWQMVEGLISSPNESDWRRAIIEADIMLASLLTEKGYPGETLGEQLKHANPLQFSTLNDAWEAHRTRNVLAHLGEGYELTEREARATINRYQNVFEEFGFI